MAGVTPGSYELKIVKGGTLDKNIVIGHTNEDVSAWDWYAVGIDAIAGTTLFTLSNATTGITKNSSNATSTDLDLEANATTTNAYDWDDAYWYLEARSGSNTHRYLVGKLTLLERDDT